MHGDRLVPQHSFKSSRRNDNFTDDGRISIRRRHDWIGERIHQTNFHVAGSRG